MGTLTELFNRTINSGICEEENKKILDTMTYEEFEKFVQDSELNSSDDYILRNYIIRNQDELFPGSNLIEEFCKSNNQNKSLKEKFVDLFGSNGDLNSNDVWPDEIVDFISSKIKERCKILKIKTAMDFGRLLKPKKEQPGQTRKNYHMDKIILISFILGFSRKDFIKYCNVYNYEGLNLHDIDMLARSFCFKSEVINNYQSYNLLKKKIIELYQEKFIETYFETNDPNREKCRDALKTNSNPTKLIIMDCWRLTQHVKTQSPEDAHKIYDHLYVTMTKNDDPEKYKDLKSRNMIEVKRVYQQEIKDNGVRDNIDEMDAPVFIANYTEYIDNITIADGLGAEDIINSIVEQLKENNVVSAITLSGKRYNGSIQDGSVTAQNLIKEMIHDLDILNYISESIKLVERHDDDSYWIANSTKMEEYKDALVRTILSRIQENYRFHQHLSNPQGGEGDWIQTQFYEFFVPNSKKAKVKKKKSTDESKEKIVKEASSISTVIDGGKQPDRKEILFLALAIYLSIKDDCLYNMENNTQEDFTEIHSLDRETMSVAYTNIKKNIEWEINRETYDQEASKKEFAKAVKRVVSFFDSYLNQLPMLFQDIYLPSPLDRFAVYAAVLPEKADPTRIKEALPVISDV